MPTSMELAVPAARAPGGLSLRVLVVEDCEADAALLQRALCRGGYAPTCERVETAAAMRAALEGSTWDVVISDYALPEFSALAALQLLQESGQDLPFVIVSGAIGEDVAVAAMRAGAHDYLMKDNLARLASAIERELREAQIRREHRILEAARHDEAEIAAALVHVGREMISCIDTPVILERLCRLTTEAIGCDASHTLLLQAEEDVWVPISSYGHSPEETETVRLLKLPGPVLAPVLAALATTEPVQGAATPHSPAAWADQLGLRLLLYIPLRRGDEIIGLQTAGSRRLPFGARQQRIAQGIAQLASLALENARLLEQLAQANRLKSEFVATISHELRTPLNHILGYNELLLEGAYDPLTAAQTAVLYQAQASGRELSALINEMLDLNRLEAGRLTVHVHEVVLADLFAELQAEPGLVPRRAGLEVTWHVSPDLPALHTDRIKLKMVLKNLILNAAKFTERGSITVAAQPSAEGVEIRVSDTGIGIAPEVVPIIFEPFRQADSSSTRRYGGVGLGLYVVHRLLALLSGTIAVDSIPDRGSTFRVWLPLNGAPAATQRGG